jgi:hypothetical protein
VAPFAARRPVRRLNGHQKNQTGRPFGHNWGQYVVLTNTIKKEARNQKEKRAKKKKPSFPKRKVRKAFLKTLSFT